MIVVKRADGSTAAEVQIGVDGRFTVNLPPGHYFLEPLNGNPLPIAPPQDVIVAPHHYRGHREVRLASAGSQPVSDLWFQCLRPDFVFSAAAEGEGRCDSSG
jgi:hypothetical protein